MIVSHRLVSLALLLLTGYGAVVAAVLADLVSGTARARRRGERLTSRGFRRSFSKAADYLRVLAGLSTIDVMVLGAVYVADAAYPLIPAFTLLGCVGVVAVELKSVTENSPAEGRWRRAVQMLERMVAWIGRMKGGLQ